MTSLVFGVSRNLTTTAEHRFMVHLIEKRMHALGFFGQSLWLITLKLDHLLFPDPSSSLLSYSVKYENPA
jgi:hypothetical protein